MINSMKAVAEELVREVDAFYAKYRALTDDTASINLAADKWSPKEIIGHLIDSASNNHQRFVRLRLQDELRFPAYGAEPWISVQDCGNLAWETLISLWLNFNLLLAHIIRDIDEDSLGHVWIVDDTRRTLGDIAVDYLRHLREHLVHFETRLKELEDAGVSPVNAISGDGEIS